MPLELLMEEAKDMSDMALMEVVRFMRFIKSEDLNHSFENTTRSQPIRKAGQYQGKISMSDDFDEPLEDFKEYM